MPTIPSHVGAVLLIFFSASAVAQEKKAPHNVPCQKRNYKLVLFYDGFFDTPGLTPPQKPEIIGGRGDLDGRDYRTASGHWISVERVEFKTSENLHEAFEAVVASSLRVLQRGPAIGHESSGTHTGERVLLDFSKENKPSFEIMWQSNEQSNEHLWFLKSSSLREVTDFEEKMLFDCN